MAAALFLAVSHVPQHALTVLTRLRLLCQWGEVIATCSDECADTAFSFLQVQAGGLERCRRKLKLERLASLF